MRFVVEERELAELLHMLPPASWDPTRSSLGRGALISLVTPDSRECGPGAMFVAISGTRLEGASYIASALCAGAACVVAENEHPEVQDVPVVVVANCREFLSLVSQAIFDFPARRMKMIGITGTSGKTSTAYLIRRLLQGLDIASVMIGTTGYVMPDGEFFPPDALPATTPEAFALNWYLDHAVRQGAQVAVLEVSSFALAFGRVHGMRFDCGVFTNFSQDHMGYHGTMEAYLAAKLRLFTSLDEGSVAVLNADDPSFAAFRDAAGCSRVMTFSLEREADLRGDHVVSTMGRTTFQVLARDGATFDVELSIGPAFQASNCLAAIGSVHALEPTRDLSKAVQSLAHRLYIPGRYERIDCGQPFEVVVDYAHTPEEFSALFGAVRLTVQGDLLAVFGSVGADDREKRPIMARLAEEACRWSFVTVEDPRHEDASIAVHDIEKGFTTDHFTVIEDRRQAIRSAVAAARPGDMVLVLGRGHETVMYYEHEDIVFDDREEVRLALRDQGYVGSTDGLWPQERQR
ncbi:MAG: UDP-N-acetylmuramoyl-L-alanyl-D-glutamate--2,6-diaminopimelate ligase [Caldiserica bacterium]|nr:UDP-N-acetylmuramoyl-L-alanyl-D-glutamate--2,6-diaminopimelate ligase [Caldisericota bacterium]